MIRKAPREQHPEWIDIDGRCNLCDVYEARFAKLLRIFARHAAGAKGTSHQGSRNSRKQARNLGLYSCGEAKFHVAIFGGA